MDTVNEVLVSLQAMTQLWQLLLAFVVLIAYSTAQGGLMQRATHRFAWAIAGLGAVGFVFECDDWTHAVMLLAFALAAMGIFVALAWVTSFAVGLREMAVEQPEKTSTDGHNAASSSDAAGRGTSPADHAHSV